jgi:hypothetical protein
MIDAPEDLPSSLRWAVYLFQAVGFPAMVAGVFLWRLNGKLATLVEAMLGLARAVEEMRREFREGRRR